MRSTEGRSTAGFSVSHHEGAGAFAELKDEWESLWSRSIDVSDAQSWAWQHSFWQFLAPDSTPLVVVARDGEGRCAALCTVARGRDHSSLLQRLAFFGDDAPDYHHIVAAPELPLAVGMEMLGYAVQRLGARASITQFSNVPAQSYTGSVLREIVAGAGPSDDFWETETFSVPLPETLEEYLQQLGKRSRRDFGYDRRRLAKEYREVSFDVYSRPEELPKALDAIMAVDVGRWGHDSRYSTAAYRGFARALAEAQCASGIYRAYVLSVDDRPVSYVTGVLLRNELRLRAIAHDRGFPRHLSVGKVTNFYAIERCIEEGIAAYDLSRGAEGYKQWLGATPSINLHYRRFRSRPERALHGVSTKGLATIREQERLRRLYQRLRRA